MDWQKLFCVFILDQGLYKKTSYFRCWRYIFIRIRTVPIRSNCAIGSNVLLLKYLCALMTFSCLANSCHHILSFYLSGFLLVIYSFETLLWKQSWVDPVNICLAFPIRLSTFWTVPSLFWSSSSSPLFSTATSLPTLVVLITHPTFGSWEIFFWLVFLWQCQSSLIPTWRSKKLRRLKKNHFLVR